MCREWRDFKYPSRSIKFAYGLESSDCSEGRNISAINLPPFSSASVPEVQVVQYCILLFLFPGNINFLITVTFSVLLTRLTHYHCICLS